MMIKLTRDEAQRIIETYCIDEPPQGAVERLTQTTLEADLNDRGGTVRVRGDYRVDQSVIDSILYPAE